MCIWQAQNQAIVMKGSETSTPTTLLCANQAKDLLIQVEVKNIHLYSTLIECTMKRM